MVLKAISDWLFGEDDDDEQEIDAEYEEELRDDIEDRMRENIVKMYSPLLEQLRPFLSSSKKITAISTQIYLYEDEGSNLKDLKHDAKRRVRLASNTFNKTNETCQKLKDNSPSEGIQKVFGGEFSHLMPHFNTGLKTCIYSTFLDKKLLNQLALFQEIYSVEFTQKNAFTKELATLKQLEDEISNLTEILKG